MASFRRNILSVYSVNVVNGVLGIIFVPLSVSLFGTKGYGLFSIYGVLASYIALVDLGVGKNLQRLLASDRNQKTQNINLKNALGIYLLISVVLLSVIPILLLFIPAYIFPVSQDNLAPLRWIILFAVLEYVIAVPTSLIQNYCIANEHFERYSIYNLISGLYRYLIMFAGVLSFHSPEIVVGLIVSRRLIDFFVAQRLMGALPHEAWIPRFHLDELKSVVGHSTVLSIAQISQTTVIAIGSFLVNRFFGLNGLGKYRAAFDLANRVWFFSNGIGLVIFPKFTRMLSDSVNRERLFTRISAFLNTSWTAYNLISIMGVLFASFLLTFMHLPQVEIHNLFILTLLGVCLNAHANISYEFLLASGKYSVAAELSAVALIIMTFSFYLLCKSNGIYAIGWAWIISQGIYSMLADIITLIAADIRSILLCKVTFFKLILLSVSLLTIFQHFGYLHFVSPFIVLILAGSMFVITIVQLINVHIIMSK